MRPPNFMPEEEIDGIPLIRRLRPSGGYGDRYLPLGMPWCENIIQPMIGLKDDVEPASLDYDAAFSWRADLEFCDECWLIDDVVPELHNPDYCHKTLNKRP